MVSTSGTASALYEAIYGILIYPWHLFLFFSTYSFLLSSFFLSPKNLVLFCILSISKFDSMLVLVILQESTGVGNNFLVDSVFTNQQQWNKKKHFVLWKLRKILTRKKLKQPVCKHRVYSGLEIGVCFSCIRIIYWTRIKLDWNELVLCRTGLLGGYNVSGNK